MRWLLGAAALALAGFGAVAFAALGMEAPWITGPVPHPTGAPLGSPAGIPAVAGFLPWLPALAIPACLALMPAACRAPRAARLGVLLGVGMMIRLAFLPAEPLLSDDVYRYLWDGAVQSAGLSPYGVPPADPALDPVAEARPEYARWRARINHPELPTVYPPVLELLFAAVVSSGGGLLQWKLLLLVGELAIALLLMRGLSRADRDPGLAVLYLWHPLPVLESMWSAHAECLAVLALVAAVLWLEAGQARRAALALGVGLATKLLPIGLAPLLIRHAGWRALSWMVGAALVLSAPYWGAELWGGLETGARGLRAYAARWYFNDVLYRPLGWLLGLDPEDSTQVATRWLRGALACAWIVVCMTVALRRWSVRRAAFWVTAAFVVLSPTLHPWYVLWALPCAILATPGSIAPAASRALLMFSVTVLASYVVLVGWQECAVWRELWQVRVLQWAPVGLVLALAWWAGRARAPERSATRAIRYSGV